MLLLMDTIKLNLKDKSYNIKIGKGILKAIEFQKFGASKYAIITDSNVKKLYGEKLQELIRNQRCQVNLFAFSAGENSKNLTQTEQVGRKLVREGFDRNSMIIALGGGVVGDLAGFLASFYKRGIDYIQIPTTLLAQVDSSIGGKTGVNIPEGKNLFGSFYQPKAVFIDIEFLKTLPENEIKNGLAEIIKYGMVQSYELFEYLEQNFSKRTSDFYLKIIKKSVAIKAKIVEKDEREQELRKILNYGHVVGHAVETTEEYKRISHGEAVGLGMVYEGKISNKLGLLNRKDLERQNQLIQAVGLPITYKGNLDNLIEIMTRDKKVKSEKINFVLPTMIGKVKQKGRQIAFPINVFLIRKCLRSEL